MGKSEKTIPAVDLAHSLDRTESLELCPTGKITDDARQRWDPGYCTCSMFSGNADATVLRCENVDFLSEYSW